jgi:hypothetical protein
VIWRVSILGSPAAGHPVARLFEHQQAEFLDRESYACEFSGCQIAAKIDMILGRIHFASLCGNRGCKGGNGGRRGANEELLKSEAKTEFPVVADL